MPILPPNRCLTRSVAAALSLMALSGVALAQPRIVTIGGWPTSVTNGGVVFGSTGNLESFATRWGVSTNSIVMSTLPGSRSADYASDDGLWAVGVQANSGGLGGLPSDAMLTSRWTSPGGWSTLGLMTPAPALGVGGSGATYGDIHSPRDVSATGRFVVGQGYVDPNDSFLFRGWVWDAQANAGAGEMTVLPTSFDAETGSFKNGRALAVSADGQVIVGGEEPNSAGRAIVWRYNAGTSQYDMSYLPEGVDANGDPILHSIDSFHINPAGTIIVGMSFSFNETLGYPESCLTRWTWNAGTQTWDRALLYNVDANPQSISTWWTQPEWCPLPPQLIPTGMSDDGQTIVGILTYSVCGSFVRGGFIWNNDDGGSLHDLYDYLANLGTPDITSFASPNPEYPVPSLGWANDISPDGTRLVGVGGPFSSIGPGWIVDLAGGGCIAPFMNGDPSPVNFSACSSIYMNASAGGSGPLSYQWYKDNVLVADGVSIHGSLIAGAGTSRLQIEQPKPGDAGLYHVVVTGPCGSVTSSNAQVQLDPSAVAYGNTSCNAAFTVAEGVDILTPAHNPCAIFGNDTVLPSCTLSEGPGLWYSFTPENTGEYRIDTCGSNYNTQVAVFEGCGGTEIACNDESLVGPGAACYGSLARVASVTLNEGTSYRIRIAPGVDAYLYDGAITNLSIYPTPVTVANDDCANPTPAVLGANAFDTTNATVDGNAWCAPDASPDVWFSYTAVGNERIRLSTCGTSFDTVVSVHNGLCGWTLDCNDDSGSGSCPTQSILTSMRLTGGNLYTFRVAGNSPSAVGAGVLDFGLLCPADLDNGSMAGTPDNGVDINDLLYFLVGFEAGSSAVDVDDGTGTGTQDFGVDINDLLYFLIHFEAGC